MIDPIYLVGAGRAGTTWLAEMLLMSKQYWLMFEPFNLFMFMKKEYEGEGEEEYGGHLIKPWEDDNLMRDFIAKMIFGQGLARRIYKTSMLCKSIRPYFMRYIQIRCKLPMKSLFLIRDPGRVASSRLRRNYSHYEDPVPFLIDPGENPFRCHIINVLNEYLIPLMSGIEGLVILYEHLLERPFRTMERVWEYVGLEGYDFDPTRRSVSDSSLTDRRTWGKHHKHDMKWARKAIAIYGNEIDPLLRERGLKWEY